MSKTKRRRFSADFKAKVALEAEGGADPLRASDQFRPSPQHDRAVEAPGHRRHGRCLLRQWGEAQRGGGGPDQGTSRQDRATDHRA